MTCPDPKKNSYGGAGGLIVLTKGQDITRMKRYIIGHAHIAGDLSVKNIFEVILKKI